MSEGAKLGLILGAVVAAAAGGGYYFFKVYRPNHEIAGAQSEIARWETRFSAARECLLGPPPGSSKTSEALAIREMSPDPWDRTSCTPLIGKLSRGDAPDTGVPAVEQAWGTLEKAASKAALAYANHVGGLAKPGEDLLSSALDELDTAHQALRASAKMAAATTATGTPLPAAQLIPDADGSDAVQTIDLEARGSAHGIVLFGNTSSRMVQVVLTTGAAPKVARIGPGSMRAIPSMEWGLTVAPDAVRAGAFDVEGVIANGTIGLTFPITDNPIMAAAGTLDDGTAVFDDGSKLVVVKATHGALVPTTIDNKAAFLATDADGRIAVVRNGKDGAFARILGPGAADQPETAIPFAASPICLARDRVWMQDGLHVVAFGGGRPTYTHDLPGGPHLDEAVYIRGTGSARVPTQYAAQQLQGCTPDAALFRSGSSVTVCTDECRAAALPTGAPDEAITTVIAGKVVALATHGNVLGVWRDGAAATFYALPEALELDELAMTDGKVIDVLGANAKAVSVIRVPAR
jgi:hypothetical protein